MHPSDDTDRLGEGSYALDPEAGLDTLLDDAGEWLAYAEGINEVIAENVADLDLPNRRHLIRLISASVLLTRMSAQCIRQAKVRTLWDARAILGADG